MVTVQLRATARYVLCRHVPVKNGVFDNILVHGRMPFQIHTAHGERDHGAPIGLVGSSFHSEGLEPIPHGFPDYLS